MVRNKIKIFFRLSHIYLQHNLISSVHPNCFDNLSSLKVLQLNNNTNPALGDADKRSEVMTMIQKVTIIHNRIFRNVFITFINRSFRNVTILFNRSFRNITIIDYITISNYNNDTARYKERFYLFGIIIAS